jgi:sulfite reductase (ferredoxin)
VHTYDLPRFITEVMRRYADFKEKSQQTVNFNDYWRSGGRDVIEKLCKSGYNDIPLFKDDKNYYFDHGAEQLFSIKDIGRAECSAGIYDMIHVDDKAIKKNLRRLAKWNKGDTGLNELLKDTLLRSAGMLMVTRGEEPKTENEACALFTKLFIDTGMVNASHRLVIDLARLGRTDQLHEYADEVVALGREITELYHNMDNTMRFPGETENMAISPADKKVDKKIARETETAVQQGSEQADRFKDLSGVKCPLNFAQTKVRLSAMNSGEILEILLDDGPPIDNVPDSVKLDGHTIVRQEKIGDQWTVLIKKA